MASLFRLLFDTMPLACAEGAVHDQTGLPLEQQSIRALRNYMRFAPTASTRYVDNPPLSDNVRALVTDHPNQIPIWGFDATSDVNSIQGVTCRVQGDAFKRYLVLNNLTFGRQVDGVFESSVEVQFGTRKFNLTLSEESRLASFMTMDGYNPPNRRPLWPLSAWEDCGLLHVHVFDIELITGNITHLANLPDDHRDKPEVQKFLARCRLFEDIPEDQTAQEALFQDDLWRTYNDDIGGLLVLDPGAIQGVTKDLLQLRVASARVLVCCSLTLNRAFDDYVSQRATWMGRVYPVTMVGATLPMVGMKAGVCFERPQKMTIENQLPCGCGEMNEDIETLLVADNNVGNIANGPDSFPFPTWNNIFSYHLPSAFSALQGERIRVVKRGRHLPSKEIWIDGAVTRMGEKSDNRVLRTRGQGAFDNVHIAPSMKLPPVTTARTRDNVLVVPMGGKTRQINAERTLWHLDDVRMAPFCAHDCFHMHWRWLNAWSDEYLAGWDGPTPNSAPGAPMVPENQDVFIKVLAPGAVLYEVEAGLTPSGAAVGPETWQIVCHHGAAYALDVTYKATGARAAGDAGVFGTWTSFSPTAEAPGRAEFYWNLRYFLSPSDISPTERLQITDLRALLDA